jgi:hypothetical protein
VQSQDLNAAGLTTFNTSDTVRGTITSFDITPDQPNSVVAIDNLTFTADTQVPEPGTMALFGTVLLGLVAARRRRIV